MPNLTNHEKGLRRDKEILRLIETLGAVNTEQIDCLLFHNLRVCQRRLQILAKRKIIKRDRISFSEPFFYFLQRPPGQAEHVLSMAWVFVWVNLKLSSWERLHAFQREMDFKGILRADGFVAIKNTWTGKMTFSFVEMDIGESGNLFRKGALYNELYESEVYLSSWWAKLTNRFPSILVVTTDNTQKIKARIEEENEHGLEFKVYSLSEVKEECLHGHSGASSLRAF